MWEGSGGQTARLGQEATGMLCGVGCHWYGRGGLGLAGSRSRQPQSAELWAYMRYCRGSGGGGHGDREREREREREGDGGMGGRV